MDARHDHTTPQGQKPPPADERAPRTDEERRAFAEERESLSLGAPTPSGTAGIEGAWTEEHGFSSGTKRAGS